MSRTNGRSWLSYVGVTIAVVCLTGMLSAQQPPYSFNYYTYGNVSGDSTINIANPGYQVTALNTNGFPTNGTLCAMIYVFNDDEQLLECCGCMLTPDGHRQLSLTNDLLANPINWNNVTNDGVIEIVSAPPNGTQYYPYPPFTVPVCDPTGDSYGTDPVVPTSELDAWATHRQVLKSSYPETEEMFTFVSVDATFASGAERQCSTVLGESWKEGLCKCGNGD